jgi:hypothetical protein
MARLIQLAPARQAPLPAPGGGLDQLRIVARCLRYSRTALARPPHAFAG